MIHICIFSISLSIKWNRDQTNPFNSSRGLRHGDLVSPYLFILDLECLCHKIKDRVNIGIWKHLSFGRTGGPKLSHVCFVDDLIMVAKANWEQVHLIKEVMEELCNILAKKLP